LLAYNTSFHSFIQEVPHYVNHGWDPLLPIDIATGQRKEKHGSVHEYATTVSQQLYDVHKRIQEIMQQVNDDRVSNWEQPQLVTFDVGDEVYLYDPTTYEGLSSKLVNRWKGPYTVLERVNTVNYIILKDNKPHTVHVHRLKKHLSEVNESFMSELEVAEEEIESINSTIQQLLQQKDDRIDDLQRLHTEALADVEPSEEQKYDDEGIPVGAVYPIIPNIHVDDDEKDNSTQSVSESSDNELPVDAEITIPPPSTTSSPTHAETNVEKSPNNKDNDNDNIVHDVVNDHSKRRVTRLDVKRAEFEQRVKARAVTQHHKNTDKINNSYRVRKKQVSTVTMSVDYRW
jgi:hypothetical protein